MIKSLAAVASCLAAPALAEVKSAIPAGFEVETKVVVGLAPAEAYSALARVGEWWNSEHTYSGKAANMRIDARAGGCFCETIPGDAGTDKAGTIEHMRVIYAQPGKTLRMQGGLGPLQAEAATGTLTWTLKPLAGGTEITQSYVVGGYIRGGAEKLAPIVDKVLAEQMAGFQRRFSDKGGRQGD